MNLTAAEYRASTAKPKRSKYGNKRVFYDGHWFDSIKECNRYKQLQLLIEANEICQLQLQPRYPLSVNGLHICTYVADFVYRNVKTGEITTEDAKGVRTRDFINKAKLFRALYGREVVLV